MREEELVKLFGDGLKALRLNRQELDWVVAALKAGHAEEKQFHATMIKDLEQQHKKLQARIEAMYIDKLDSNIDDESYNKNSVDWRREQKEISDKIGCHHNANQSYIEEGVKILDIATRAYELYQQQPIENVRTLLDYVYSNSTWKDGKLCLGYRKPFDLISKATEIQDAAMVANGVDSDENIKNKIWLPRVDSNHEPPG